MDQQFFTSGFRNPNPGKLTLESRHKKNQRPFSPSSSLSLLPHPSPVTMLAQLHPGLPVNPLSSHQPTHRTLPHVRRNPRTPGNIHSPRQRDRGHLLIFHRIIVTRAAHPPGILQVLGPGPALLGEFLNKPGAFLPADITRGLRFREFKLLVIIDPDGPFLILVYNTWVRIPLQFTRFTACVVRILSPFCYLIFRLRRNLRKVSFFYCKLRIMETLITLHTGFFLSSSSSILFLL